MSLVIPKPDGKEFDRELPTAGMHRAVCSGIIDLGIQTWEYQGQQQSKPQIVLLFELDQTYTKGDYAGKRMIVSRKVTKSLHEKANLRKLLETWRAKKFSDAELNSGHDIHQWVGAPAMITIVIKEEKYANIQAINPLMSGMEKLEILTPGHVPMWVKELANKGEGNEHFVLEKSKPKFEDDIPF